MFIKFFYWQRLIKKQICGGYGGTKRNNEVTSFSLLTNRNK